MNDKKGVIYILTNPSFPDYVKIGYADDIDKRLKQLNRSECIPFAFRVYATYEVNSRLDEKTVDKETRIQVATVQSILEVILFPSLSNTRKYILQVAAYTKR